MKYCEEFEALLDLYVDGELEVADMIRVQEHLDGCPACQAYVDELMAIRAAFPEIEDTVVPEGFAEGVMAAIAASAPKAKKRPTPWKKVLIPMAACLAVVVMALPLSGLMNNARMEAAPAEAPAAAMESAIADSAKMMADSPAEMVMEAPAEAPAAPMPEEAQDIHYAYTTAETEAAPAPAAGTDSRIGSEEGVIHDASQPEMFTAAKQSGDPRAVITLPPEGANLELLVGRAADRQAEGRMEFDLPASDYEMLLIQLDESGLDYLAEEYPAAAGNTILVIIELEQVQQN